MADGGQHVGNTGFLATVMLFWQSRRQVFPLVPLQGLLDLHYFLGTSPGALGHPHHAVVLGIPLLCLPLGPFAPWDGSSSPCVRSDGIWIPWPHEGSAQCVPCPENATPAPR